MGIFGWVWLKDEVEKLKTLRSITKDAEQVKVLDEVIANLEKKVK